MLPSTTSCLRQGPTHVTDTGRCPTPCPNPIEVVQLGQLFSCCSRSGASPSSRACSVLFPALRLSRAAVCAATELLVHCCQDLSDLRTASVLRPDQRGGPVVTVLYGGNIPEMGHTATTSRVHQWCTGSRPRGVVLMQPIWRKSSSSLCHLFSFPLSCCSSRPEVLMARSLSRTPCTLGPSTMLLVTTVVQSSLSEGRGQRQPTTNTKVGP